MEIKNISLNELGKMNGSEGLVIQGCGGNLQEWVDGLNDSLNESGILKNNSRFENAYTFNNDGITCLFFPFVNVECDIEKMAVWRIKTHNIFCGTWFSDFVNNRLGGFAEEVQPKKKPPCPLENVDGNIFNIMGLASKALRRAGMTDDAKEMCERVTHSGNYHQALGIIMDYVDVSPDDESEEAEMENLSQQQ